MRTAVPKAVVLGTLLIQTLAVWGMFHDDHNTEEDMLGSQPG